MIATAAILMAAKLEKYDLPATKEGKPWHSAFVDVDASVLRGVRFDFGA